MPHPFMTTALVRQRRAALDAQAHNQRLAHQLPPRTRPDPEPGRLAVTAQTLARQVRALVARAT